MAVANIQPRKRPDTFLHSLGYLKSITDYRRTKKTAFYLGDADNVKNDALQFSNLPQIESHKSLHLNTIKA